MADGFSATWQSDALLRLSGHLDASHAAAAEAALERVAGSTVVDFSDLVYISSAGIGCLLAAQKRLGQTGKITIVNPSPSIREMFALAGFDTVFEIR